MKHKITALRAQKRNPQRINVYLDGEFAFGLARIVAAWLYVGQELEDEKIAHLQDDDGREKAYQKALNFLSYRPRSEAEIRRNLGEHSRGEEDHLSEETIEYVIERLKENGLLNDTRFAKLWVENRSEMRPRSRRALEYELKQLGVDAQTIAQSLEEVDEQAMAYRLAQKQARKIKELEWKDFRQKMYRSLAQRGFDYEIISIVTQQTWDETHAQTDLDNNDGEEGAYL
jgi:regulatory protein